jgi:hypothetical protein
MAKSLLEQNRHKVGDMVGKATVQVDKVSKGKTSNVSAKVEEAARKYSAGGVTHHGDHPDAAPDKPITPDAAPGTPITPDVPADDAELQRRQAEANIAAANALTAAAAAAAGIFNKAALQQAAGASRSEDGAPDSSAGESGSGATPSSTTD